MSHVNLVLADDGRSPRLLDGALARIGERLGVHADRVTIGDGTTARIAHAIDKARARDENARVVLVGYGDGMSELLSYVHRARTGPSAERVPTASIAGVVSLYGTHNGALAIPDGTLVSEPGE